MRDMSRFEKVCTPTTRSTSRWEIKKRSSASVRKRTWLTLAAMPPAEEAE
jgi:hypothetical protein